MVTIKDVEHIAKLARLEFSPDEKEKFTHQLNRILEYVETLNRLDTSGVVPLSHVNELQNPLREDEVKKGLSPEEAMMNAPAKTDRFFKVPKTVKGENE